MIFYVDTRLLESKMVLKGHNRKSLSKAIGVGRETISNLLGSRANPSYKLMLLLIDELSLSENEASSIFFARKQNKMTKHENND